MDVTAKQGFKSETKNPNLSVGKVANGCVDGKVAATGSTNSGKAPGTAIKGFSGGGVKAGKV